MQTYIYIFQSRSTYYHVFHCFEFTNEFMHEMDYSINGFLYMNKKYEYYIPSVNLLAYLKDNPPICLWIIFVMGQYRYLAKIH